MEVTIGILTNVFSGFLVLAVLVCIVYIMIRPEKSVTDKTRSTNATSRFGWTPLTQGALSAIALGASVQNAGASGWSSGLVAGTTVGLLFAMLSLTGGHSQIGSSVLSFIFGTIGLVFDYSTYFDPASVCTPTEFGRRAFGLVFVILGLAVGALIAGLRGLFRINKLGTFVLAMYGSLELVEFISSPLGVSVIDLGTMGWIVSIVATLAFGFAVSIWPESVIAVASISLVASNLFGVAFGSASCAGGSDASALAPMIGFFAVYVLFGSVTRVFIHR